MAKDCWCDLPFHFPGEVAKHKKSYNEAVKLLQQVAKIDKGKKK